MTASLLRIEQVAEVLGVSKARAYALAREGTLPGIVRLKKQVRVDGQKLRDFIERGGEGICPSPERTA